MTSVKGSSAINSFLVDRQTSSQKGRLIIKNNELYFKSTISKWESFKAKLGFGNASICKIAAFMHKNQASLFADTSDIQIINKFFTSYNKKHICCKRAKLIKFSKSDDSKSQKIKSSYSLKNVTNLNINKEKKITKGHGEYLVFRKNADGKTEQLDKDTFDQAYQILNDYNPISIMRRNPTSGKDECINRYELMKEKIKELDPTLEIVFIPRCLYELVFIKKCINEDLKHKQVCEFISRPPRRRRDDSDEDYAAKLNNRFLEQKAKKCWHLCYFTNAGDNNAPGVKDVAYRLNKAILKSFTPNKDGFTQTELVNFAKNELKFLQDFYYSDEECEMNENGYPGPASNFISESTRNTRKPMGIRDDKDANIVLNALALECSQLAVEHFILYRGSNLEEDNPVDKNFPDDPYGLSLGSGVFSGCIYDGGATAFHYMRSEKNAFAISIPFDQLDSSPFYIPEANTIAQLFGNGEAFHGRTKGWKGCNLDAIYQKNKKLGIGADIKDHLQSNLTKDEFTVSFENYKINAIHLK